MWYRRRDNRSRDYDSTRDSNRDRGRGRDRAGGNPRQRPHNRASEDHPRDSRNSRNDRHGDFRKFPDDQSRIQDRRRDKLRDGRQVQNDRRPKGSSSQPLPGGRDERGEYPINDQGVIVSPDNIRRARDHREVKNVDGKWVKPEDTGETCFSPIPYRTIPYHSIPHHTIPFHAPAEAQTKCDTVCLPAAGACAVTT